MTRNRERNWTRLANAIAASAALVSTQAADYATKVLENGPLHYWRLNEKATVPGGDRAVNLGSLGAALNGYYTGAALHPTPGGLVGSSDTAAGFDATAGTAVSIPYTPDLNPSGAFTVEAWLSPNADTTTAAPTCALSSGQFGAPRSGWLLYQVDNGWSFRMYNQNGTAFSVNLVSGDAPVIGNWYHVVAVYDGTTASVYVNGVQKATGAPSGYVPSAGGAFFIGGRADSSFWWNGTADEVAVYGKALTASEIDAHYKNGASATPAKPYNQLVLESTPLAYYRLNEDTYTPPATLPAAADLGSAGNSGDASYYPGMDGKAAGPQPPIYKGFEADNSAGGFNGTAGYVGTPANLNDLTTFTVTGWIKRGAIHSGRGGYFGQNDLLEFGDADSGANIEAWINAYGTNIKIPYPFRDNEWGLITLVADGTQATLYTNGVAASTITQTVETYGSSSFNFNIGGGGVFNASGDYFFGNIDEVAIFDKALTAEQVQALYYSADIAPVIVTQPAAPNRDIFEGNAVTLSVAAVGSPTLRYQWRKGGQDLPGKTTAELTFASITTGDAGNYDVVVSNDYGSATSTGVTLTVKPADNTPPVLQYAAGTANFTGVKVWFSEPLDPATAQTAGNYQITDGVTVTAAALSAPPGTPGDNIVILTTSAQTPGKTYTLTVSGVKDQSSPGNSVAAGSTAAFSSWTYVQGYLTFEHYDNISGAADSDITKGLADPRVIAGTPTTAGFITGAFDTRSVFPDDSHEQYLARITGFITPKESGDYYFFLGSDDAGRLYLSKTETIPDPATDTPICTEPTCCRAFQEPESGLPVTTATPITLQAGKRYGVLALLKEAGGGDHLEVAWRKSTDSTPAAELPRIPAEFFATLADPNVDFQFTKQPTDQHGVVPTPVVDFATVNFQSNDGGFTVEDTDPAAPGPWTYSGGQWSADGGGSGPYNSRLVSPAFTVPQTEDVTLTFTHRYSFEGDYWDGGQVQISVNGGAFTPVNPDNFTANGYAPGKIQGTGVLNGQRAFNGASADYASGTFITSSVILGSFTKNDKIVVRFVGAWDEGTVATAPNWAIKSLKLAYGKAAQAVTFEAEAKATRQGQTATFGYQWQRNDGAGFVDIPNATAASYRFFPTAADFSATFRAVASVPGKALASNAVKLTTGNTTPPEISISRASGSGTITIEWTGGGTLQAAPTVQGPWQDVAGATSPYTFTPSSEILFGRIKQ